MQHSCNLGACVGHPSLVTALTPVDQRLRQAQRAEVVGGALQHLTDALRCRNHGHCGRAVGWVERVNRAR